MPGEEPAIWAVYYGSTRHVVARDYTAAQVARWAPDAPDMAAWITKLAHTNPFVAVLDGKIVGFAELEPDGHIDCFYCHHAYQRRGIGTHLLLAVEAEGHRLRLRLYAEVSTTAIPFFLAKGFRVLQERINTVCDAPAKQFFVEKVFLAG